jgi:hypothetical protein
MFSKKLGATKMLTTAALAAGALFGASSVLANDGHRHGHGKHYRGHGHAKHWHGHGRVVVMPAPRVYYTPAPVYVAPRPVYVAPQPVYVVPRPTIVLRDRNFSISVGF